MAWPEASSGARAKSRPQGRGGSPVAWERASQETKRPRPGANQRPRGRHCADRGGLPDARAAGACGTRRPVMHHAAPRVLGGVVRPRVRAARLDPTGSQAPLLPPGFFGVWREV